MKLFSTFNNKVATQGQFYTGFTTVEYLARERKAKLKILQFSPCLFVRTVYEILTKTGSSIQLTLHEHIVCISLTLFMAVDVSLVFLTTNRSMDIPFMIPNYLGML